MSPFRASLLERARRRPRTIVFADGADARVQEAVARLQLARAVVPLVIGDPDGTRSGVAAYGGDGAVLEVVHPATDPELPAFIAELHARRADRGWSRARAEQA